MTTNLAPDILVVRKGDLYSAISILERADTSLARAVRVIQSRDLQIANLTRELEELTNRRQQ